MFGEALHGGQWSVKQTEALMRKADANHDGEISVDEWLKVYQPFLDPTSVSDRQFETRVTSFRVAVLKMQRNEVTRMGTMVDRLQHEAFSSGSRIEQLKGVFEACDVSGDGLVSKCTVLALVA